MRHTRTLATLAMAGLVALLGATAVGAASTPEATVKEYLKAMKDQKYEDAYKQISKAMAGGKDAEAWAKEQKYMMQAADVKIFKFEVYPSQGRGRRRRRSPTSSARRTSS